jgi:DNA-binding CsgD family transcriptional regulator/ArsR family metal-binding transcriptional regulator
MTFLSGYKKISVSRVGVMPCVGPKMGACFEVDHDLRPLFPYINASLTKAKYFNSPKHKHIQFVLDGVLCSLYSYEIVVAAFHDYDGARLYSERLLRYLNKIFESRHAIKPCYKTIVPLSPMKIYRLLPQTNCGKCGLVSCLAFAASVSKGKANSSECPGFSKPIATKAVYPIFDKNGNLSSTIDLSIPDQQLFLTTPKNLLTNRELQVLTHLSNGATNHEISEALFISQHTVKTHVTHIFDKLGVNDRTQAAVWATRRNLI